MMGEKKLSTMREEVRDAFAAEGVDPIAFLDSEIRKARRKRKPNPTVLETLNLLHDALAEGVKPKRPGLARSGRKTKRKKTA